MLWEGLSGWEIGGLAQFIFLHFDDACDRPLGLPAEVFWFAQIVKLLFFRISKVVLKEAFWRVVRLERVLSHSDPPEKKSVARRALTFLPASWRPATGP